MPTTVPRRSILAAAAAGGLTALVRTGAFAQPKQRIYRVGVLSRKVGDDDSGWTDFVAELSLRGYVVGSNLFFDRRVAAADRLSDLTTFAESLVQAKVDVIYTEGGTAEALAAKRATSTIPIVFLSSADPVGLGLVQSLSRPGGNLTGSSIQSLETIPKSLQLLAQASGKLTSIAYLHTADTRGLPWYPAYAAAVAKAADALRCRVQFADVGPPAEAEMMLRRLVRQGVDGVGVLGGGTPFSDAFAKRLPSLLIELRLPSIGDAADGFLLGYSTSGKATRRLAAKLVDQVLQGAKPADLPIEQVSTFELEINLRTAKALGLSVPSSVLLQATRLIE